MGPRPPPQRIQFPVYDHEGYQSELSQYLPDISGSSRMLMNKMDQGKFNSVRRVRDDGYYMAEEPRMRKQVRTNTFGGGGGGYNMMNNNPGQQFSFLRGSNPNNAFND